MVDDPKTKKDSDGEQEEQAKPKKSGKFLKIALYGGVGTILIAALAVGAMFFMAGDDEANLYDDSDEYQTEADEFGSSEDTLFGDDDQTILDAIMENLAALDYKPHDSELEDGSIGMSLEDSLEQMNWIDSEKARLATLDKELASRRRELDILDQKVSQKILRIEQAESARVANLAKLYDGMQDRAVAKLMANLDDATVVSIIPRMKVKNASAVLSLMPAKRAAQLSKQMITIAEK